MNNSNELKLCKTIIYILYIINPKYDGSRTDDQGEIPILSKNAKKNAIFDFKKSQKILKKIC